MAAPKVNRTVAERSRNRLTELWDERAPVSLTPLVGTIGVLAHSLVQIILGVSDNPLSAWIAQRLDISVEMLLPFALIRFSVRYVLCRLLLPARLALLPDLPALGRWT